jgi:hypothetical protein
MFATAQQVNNSGGLEFTVDAARADDVRAAAGNADEEKSRERTRNRGAWLKPRKLAGAQRARRRARWLEGCRQREERASPRRSRGAESTNVGA